VIFFEQILMDYYLFNSAEVYLNAKMLFTSPLVGEVGAIGAG
jgi:hypothetical protein